MDVKFVFVLVILCTAEAGVVFNFHERVRQASSTTENSVDASQIIRVPNLACADGYRRDDLGNCRQQL
ncbi:unnamed protein product [Pieris macdunnoughi]|uniref:Insect cytokine uENF2 n=1 Tax=Pieris macdunnoughi TaxID=345717 RepID=A0A821X0F1_9NEOP|nr:unnamed protein product [Pieris macdunnoughi]